MGICCFFLWFLLKPFPLFKIILLWPLIHGSSNPAIIAQHLGCKRSSLFSPAITRMFLGEKHLCFGLKIPYRSSHKTMFTKLLWEPWGWLSDYWFKFEFLFLPSDCCNIMNSSAKGFQKKLMHLKKTAKRKYCRKQVFLGRFRKLLLKEYNHCVTQSRLLTRFTTSV